MENLRSFRDVLSFVLMKMRRPVMFLPASIMFSVPQVLAMGYAGLITDIVETGSAEQLRLWSGRQGPAIALVALVLAFLAPAGVSGLASLARASLDRQEGDWRDFHSGLGTYYGKALGAYLLFALAVALCGKGFFRWTAELVGAYFFAPWIAAAVFEGTGIVASISIGAKFAWRNPGLLIPAYLLHEAGKFLVQAVTSRSAFTVDPSLSLSLKEGWFFGAALGGAAYGYLYMAFLLVCFTVYRMRKAEVPKDPGENLDPGESTQ